MNFWPFTTNKENTKPSTTAPVRNSSQSSVTTATVKLLHSTSTLPRAIRQRIQRCLNLHDTLSASPTLISHEDSYLIGQMFETYVPEIIKQFDEAARLGRLHDIIDGDYTIAQVCDQNIAIIEKRLQLMIQHRQNESNNGVLIQRNFLQEILSVDELPEASDHKTLTETKQKKEKKVRVEIKKKARAEIKPSYSSRSQCDFQPGDRIYLNLPYMLTRLGKGDIDLLEQRMGYGFSRDLKRKRFPRGRVWKRDTDGHFIVDIKKYGRMKVEAAYLFQSNSPKWSWRQ